MKNVIFSLPCTILFAACGGSPNPGGTSAEKDAALTPVERKYGMPANKVFDATLSAFKSLELRIDVDRHDDLGGETIARPADGRRVTADLASLRKTTTQVSIRADRTTQDAAARL